MRAVKANAFVWAALVVIIGLDERLAFVAAIIGLALAVFPLFFAPRLEPTGEKDPHHHTELYRALHPGQGRMPTNPQPGDEAKPSYTPGSWS